VLLNDQPRPIHTDDAAHVWFWIGEACRVCCWLGIACLLACFAALHAHIMQYAYSHKQKKAGSDNDLKDLPYAVGQFLMPVHASKSVMMTVDGPRTKPPKRHHEGMHVQKRLA